jgi:hypothetical protein
MYAWSILSFFPLSTDIHPCSWDTSMSQKSRFKMQTQGITTFRNTFPQLPGGTLKNPECIQTAHGQVFHDFPFIISLTFAI